MAKKKRTLEPGEAQLKNAKWELFSVLYAGLNSKKYFGNATQCYLHVYGGEEKIMGIEEKIEDTFEEGAVGDNERRRLKGEKRRIEHVANVEGCRLLAKPGIALRTEWLLDRYLSDERSDREMAYVIAQREDLSSKVQAYVAVAKVKARVRGAGAIQGDFEFSWEGDEEDSTRKRPSVRAKMAVSAMPKDDPEDGVEWE